MIELYKFTFDADGSMELTQTRSATELSNSVAVAGVTNTRQCIEAAKRMFRRIIVITQGE